MANFFKINSLAEIFKFLELPPPKHPLIAFIDFSATPFDKDLPAHKVVCDLYQISFKGGADGFIKYGREKYDYQEGALMYLAPQQVVEYLPSKNNVITSGWSLFFHPDLIQTFGLAQKIKTYHFFDYHSNEALHISEKEKAIVFAIIKQIEIELDANLDDFSEEVIVTNIELLLNYSKRFYNRQFITRKRFHSGVVAQFNELLDRYFERELQSTYGIPTVQYFADQLNYSPNYLNELIKKGTGQSILEHIHHKIISLAKSKLLNSNQTASEIAFELGFEYSQYFSRLFKKKTGITPKEYRTT